MSLSAFMDEEEVNPHQAAWLMRDWDKVEELTKEFTKNSENELFEVLNQLNQGKKRLCIAGVESYDKWYVDTAMSQHIDTIYPAYVMNLIGAGLSDQAHFDYYLNEVRSGRRTGAWAKLVEDGEQKVILKVLERIYSINTRIAMEYHQELIDLNQLDVWKKRVKPLAVSAISDVVKNKKDQKTVEKIINKW